MPKIQYQSGTNILTKVCIRMYVIAIIRLLKQICKCICLYYINFQIYFWNK